MHTPTVIRRGVKLRLAEFRERASEHGLDNETAIAGHLGMHRVSVWRLLRGEVEPGTNFIGAVLDTFPDATFEEFFEVTRTVAIREAA
jgi:hypothetical protein